MMKRFTALALLALILPPLTYAQKYEMSFVMPQEGVHDSMLYIGQHYRDQFRVLDSARLDKKGTYTFAGNRKWETGIYALLQKDAKKSLIDFTIDGSQRFTIRLTEANEVANPKKDIVGSPANQAMHSYLNKLQEATKKAREIDQRKKSADPKIKQEAEEEMKRLSTEVTDYENNYIKENERYLFGRLVKMFREHDVPEEVEDKSAYYISHYWDGIDLTDHSLVNTPDLFKKMNYYFFGVLYHADKDTICKYADRVLHAIEGDTLMLRYFLDFIMPRYYRSTKNIGWDAVWCYLVREYYLTGKCKWASTSDITNKRKTVEFLEKSLIGAMGAELWMADTNQSTDPKDWISSHRFPQKYVILWFWDPDCHHCQEQTASLKQLYDSLSAAGNKIFEVYAVGYEADVAKWKKYVREHELPFVNVGGSNVNIDYQEAYNVHGAPTMIILNEERRIIMNKVLPTKSILPFLKRYEETMKLKIKN